MRSVTSLFTICGIYIVLLSITTACSSSRRVNRDGQDDSENDSGSESDFDGGTSREPDSGEESYESASGGKTITAGSGGSVVPGSVGPFKTDASDSMRCDSDGYCYWPDGHYCDPWGTCCYPDGHCESEPTATATAGTISGVATAGAIDPGIMLPTTPFMNTPSFMDPLGGIDIDPDDFTKQPWNPPIDDLAEPRWRDSGEPLCTGIQGSATSQSVWSDSRGVYVLVSGAGVGEYQYEYDESMLPPGMSMPPPGLLPGLPFGTCVGEGCPRIEIYFNDGNGWDSTFLESTATAPFGSSDVYITGFEDGPILMYGDQNIFPFLGSSDSCGLAFIENGTKTCEPITNVDDVFVVNDRLAYAVYQGDLIHYTGSSWGPIPGALTDSDISLIWATENRLFAVMYGAGRIGVSHDGVWEVLDTGTLEEFSALWGFSESDLWAGTNGGGVFHCDGMTCNEISWEGDNCAYDSEIRQMWGSDGVVYFYTSSTIARIFDSKVEVLASLPCAEDSEVPRITSLWGNGPNEVFFTLVDESFPRRECGVVYVVWFDGNEFHQF